MEAVLNVRVPGIFMPWKEMMRGCLVIILFGILCLSVQNYAQRNEVLEATPAGSAVKRRTVALAREADLAGVYENVKPAVSDMRSRLTDFPSELGTAVQVVPVQNTMTLELEVFRSIQTQCVTEDLFVLPERDTGIRNGSESTIFNEMDTDIVLPVMPKEESENEKWIDVVIPEESITTEETDVPEESIMEEETAAPEEIAGFILDSEGYIIGYTEEVILRDGLLFIPESEGCVGIRRGALDGLGESITEIYLSENIIDLEAGVFDAFPCLMFVEVSGNNPSYYSDNGILYSISGEEIFCPFGRTIE